MARGARHAMRGALIAAASIGLAGPAVGQHTFSSGETDYGRHVELLLDTDLPDPELLKAQALSELSGELWLASASALNALDACRAEPGMDPLAAALCVNEHAVAVLAPEALATEIEQYCSYMAHLNKRPEPVAGCFVQSWRKISGRALGLRQSIERFTACSFPDLIRLRELHIRRTEAYLEQIIPLDTLLSQVAAHNPQLSYYNTLEPQRALEQLNRAYGFLQDALEQAQRFSDTLATDSPPIKVGTLIAISTAQQRFSWCHNRHPDKAEEWKETFAAYAEGSPASIPTWVNAVPTVANPRPIDVRGAARRTFEAMVRAHERPLPTLGNDKDIDQEVEPQPRLPPEDLIQACQEHSSDLEVWTRNHEIYKARLAELTGSVWAGCGDEFLFGAAMSVSPDLSSVGSALSVEVAGEVAKRSGRTVLARIIKGAGGGALSVASAAAHGYVASEVCRSRNERPMKNPKAPGLDDKGEPVSTGWMLGGGVSPGSVTIPEMNELIETSQNKINEANANLTVNCLAELQAIE